MPECIECGAYTKYHKGRCYDCYQSKEKQKASSSSGVNETSSTYSKAHKSSKNDNGENPWTSGVIKGRIAETIVEELFRSLGFQVFSYGMENSIPGIKDLLKGVRGDVANNIRKMPDFVIFKNKKAHFIEVKYRKSEKLALSEIEENGDYPFENALFVLVTPRHIKCISYNELRSGKEITPTCRNYLGSRDEFDTDKNLIIEYCKYAVKFFEGV